MVPSSSNSLAAGGAPQDEEGVPQPPGMPDFERRVQLTQLQRWGLPLLLLAPLLALIGPLGMSHDQVVVGGEPLRVAVEYPSRSRTGVTTTLTATVWNDGSEPVGGVRVTLPREFLESFEAFDMRPAATTVTADDYSVFVGDVPAGESRVVTVLLTPGEYWDTQGTVTVASAAMPTPLTAEFSTFNFP